MEILHIAVVIRNTVDCRVILPADSYGEKPLKEAQIKIINPSDWSALEQAIELKDSGLAKLITVISLGTPDEEDSLRWCLAAGADKAIRVWDNALRDSDQLGKGKVIAAAISRLNVDLVLSGDRCLDQTDSLMPGIAAGVSNMPYLVEIEKIENIENYRAVCIRRQDKGKRERIAIQLPAHLALTEKNTDASKRAGLEATLAALTSVIQCLNLEDLGLSADTVGGRASKVINIYIRTAKPPITRPKTPNFRLPAQERLKTVISGGEMRQQGEVVTGQADQLADKIIEFLYRE